MTHEEAMKLLAGDPIKGVIYNVVRRPLSGGKGNIVRHKPTRANPAGESKDQFYQRVASYIREDPASYFMRWRVEVTQADIQRFRTECLDPILMQLCDWYSWVTKEPRWPGQESPFQSFVPAPNKLHWRHPYGVWNVLDEGGSTDLDEYLATGSMLGLVKDGNLFKELADD